MPAALTWVTARARLPVPENPVPFAVLLLKTLKVTVAPVPVSAMTTPVVLLLVFRAVIDASILPLVPPAVACTLMPPLVSLVALTMSSPDELLTIKRKLPPVSAFTDEWSPKQFVPPLTGWL